METHDQGAAPPDLIRPCEAARLLAVSTRCVWRWVAQGRVRGWRVGRALRVSRGEVLAMPKPVEGRRPPVRVEARAMTPGWALAVLRQHGHRL